MKKISLKHEFEKIQLKNEYYLKFNRNLKINYNNYFSDNLDPDGKKRNLKKEEKFKLSQLKLIRNFLNENFKKKTKILDFGCGYGWLLKSLNKKKWDKNAIEINPDANKFVKNLGIDCRKSIDDYNNKYFDIITLIHVIEHLDKPEKTLKKIVSKIKKKGHLIIETPDFDSAMARRYNLKFRLLHDKTHISLFSTESLTRLLMDQNMKIKKIEYPYFEGPFFTKKNILKLFAKKQKTNYSPPFYGSVVTIFATKK